MAGNGFSNVNIVGADGIEGSSPSNPVVVATPGALATAWSYAAAAGGIVNTTGVAFKDAPAAGLKNYVTAIQLANNSAVPTEIEIRDGVAGTVLWRGMATANMPITNIPFATPLKGSVITALEVACVTTAAKVYFNAQGYLAA